MNIGEKIKELRLQKRMTQDALQCVEEKNNTRNVKQCADESQKCGSSVPFCPLSPIFDIY